MRAIVMTHEHSLHPDQFWLAEPLSILAQTVLTKAFSLGEADDDLANRQVLQYMEILSRSGTPEEAWQERSFYELLVEASRGEADALKSVHELYVNLFRSN